MKIFKRKRRYLLGTLLLILVLPLLGAILPRRWYATVQQSCTYQVCVVRSGYHSRILVPTQTQNFDWHNYLNLYDANETASTYTYLGFGWGEREWYVSPPTPDNREFRDALRALFLLNASALKVQRYAGFPQHYETKCVGVTPENYLNLMEFIQNSFQRNSQGEKIKLASDAQSKSIFYEAKGTYFLLNNSNNWTARGLESAEINTPVWASHAITIMSHLVDTC
ncbi:MAG: DUF2459 domain-containing protein [Leptolyngbyaceae cyanobacterium RM1_406_9]|nr:DUF2459 domain-containing protein [Leptolyngbyaceae cyanobacterium RM1_406_9]